RYIREYNITTLHFVPVMLNAFLDYVDNNNVKDIPSLRHIIASGEVLTPDVVQKHHSLLNIPLHNLYCPTEASVDVTHYTTKPNNELVPIGKPVWNTRMYIVDTLLRLCPIGVLGEICIEGIALANGYVNNPELTSEKFVESPFSP